MMLALGTSSVQSMLSDTPYSNNGVIGTIRDGVIPGYYMWESGLAAVGDQLAWYANHCGALGEEGDALTILTRRAGLLAPGECGLLALDWWNGNKTPYVNGHLAGVLVGLRLDTSPDEIFRALMESTAFGTRVILGTFEQAGKPVEEIIACGGIVDKNPVLMQIYADVLGREIKVAGSNQTMALGAAIYAAVAAGSDAGGYDSLGEAARHMTRLKPESYRPNWANHAVYDRLFREYQTLSGLFGQEHPETLQCLRALRKTDGQPQ
jgi:L-ribulokinase